MNFDKFKNVLPQKIQLKSDDTEYLQHLNGLKEPKSSNALRIVATIAAAVVIVLAVSLWALIGRGVRDAGEPIVSPPATEGVRVQITDEMQSAFNEMSYKLRLFALPIFERGENPAQKAFSDYVYYLTTPAKSDWIITATELNDLYFDTFGVKSDFTEGITYSGPYSVNVSMTGIALLSFTRGALQDGTPIITLTYGEPDVSVTTLTYVPITDFEPDYFIEHTTANTVYVHKVASEYKEYVYKVTGDDASELLQIIDTGNKTKETNECFCFATHRIIFNGISYDIVMGDEYRSHFTHKPTKSNYMFTASEQKRLKELFEKCLVENNKERIDQLDPKKQSKDITVTVNDDITPQMNGTYTITGGDADAIADSLEKLPYANDIAKFLPSISLKIGERTYYLHTGNDPFVRTSCGQYPLEKDSAIIIWVEKYIGSSWTKDGNGWYETDDGYFVTNDYGKTFEKYITRKKAVLIANAEAMNRKYSYQPWASDFYLDENSKDVTLVYADNKWWEKEWQTEYYREGAPCWAVQLFDYNDALTSLILYIDAKTGKVVGGATISD